MKFKNLPSSWWRNVSILNASLFNLNAVFQSYKLKENLFETNEGLKNGMKEGTKNLEESRGLAKCQHWRQWQNCSGVIISGLQIQYDHL